MVEHGKGCTVIYSMQDKLTSVDRQNMSLLRAQLLCIWYIRFGYMLPLSNGSVVIWFTQRIWNLDIAESNKECVYNSSVDLRHINIIQLTPSKVELLLTKLKDSLAVQRNSSIVIAELNK